MAFGQNEDRICVEEEDEYRYFAAGTQEIDGVAGCWCQGMYNLTPGGEGLFLEAVATIIPEPATIAPPGRGGVVLLRRKRRFL